MPQRFTAEVVQMLEHIPNAFYALDRDLRFIHLNRRILELMRKSEEELIGKYIWDVYPNWIGTEFQQTLHDSLKNGTVGHIEQYYKPASQWVEVYAYPSEYGLAIYVNDITARKKMADHLFLLNRAGDVLAANHDIEEGLEQLGQLLVPGFADWFTIDHLVEDKVEILIMRHEDQEKVRWGMDYRARTEVEFRKPKRGSLGWVIRIGTPVLLNGVTEEMVGEVASDPEHLEVLRKLDIKAAMIVPVAMRGKTIGALTFLSSDPDKQFDESDLDFARNLASRIGLAIANARMFEDAKRELSRKIRSGELRFPVSE